jgi:hypothetical protein
MHPLSWHHPLAMQSKVSSANHSQAAATSKHACARALQVVIKATVL